MIRTGECQLVRPDQPVLRRQLEEERRLGGGHPSRRRRNSRNHPKLVLPGHGVQNEFACRHQRVAEMQRADRRVGTGMLTIAIFISYLRRLLTTYKMDKKRVRDGCELVGIVFQPKVR